MVVYLAYLPSRIVVQAPFGWLFFKSFGAGSRYLAILFEQAKPGRSRIFKKDSKLQQYFLEQVIPTGKTLGTGSYGSVLEVSGKF